MSFQVDPTAIRAYAAQIVSHGEAAQAMHDYIAQYSHLRFHEQGLINLMWPAHEQFAGEVTTALAHLQDLLARSRRELEGVASLYERTDSTSARRIDDTYPQVPRFSHRQAG